MLDELKKLFVLEVKDLLENTEKNLLLLEKDRDNENIQQEIFRTMHTIKGSAGMYDLSLTSKIAHDFENIFTKIKDGKLSATNEVISLTLKAKDVILELIEAKSESDVDSKKTDNIIAQIEKVFSEQTEKTTKKNIKKEEQNTKKEISSLYILFEPNIDVEERGVKIPSILSDFDEFEHKIITEFVDESRKTKNKTDKYYEIIVASEFSIDDVRAIFMFVSEEVSLSKISDYNIFEEQDFVDFYENAVKILPDSKMRFDLISNYAKKEVIEEEIKNEEDNKEEVLIGADEIIVDIEKEAKEQQIQYIKVPAKRLDELLNLVSELIISNSQLSESATKKDFSNILELSESIDKTVNSIKENTLDLRLIPIRTIIAPYRRIIRDISLKLNKKIEFIEDGVDTLVDKTIVDKIFTPLLHIIRNAVDHGIEEPTERISKGKPEKGIVRFIAYYSNTNVVIQIQDDGKGIDPDFIKQKASEINLIDKSAHLSKKEIYDLLFVHGFTTTTSVSEISGRGVGMDAIKKAILDLRGDIEIDSEIGLGTSVTIKVPLTLSIVETMHVAAGDMHFLIPVINIDRCINIDFSKIEHHSGARVVIDDEVLPYIDIQKVFKIKGEVPKERKLIIINQGRTKIGLVFSEIFGEYQAVIKNLGHIFGDLDFIIGASILGDGSIGYILDSNKLVKKIKS